MGQSSSARLTGRPKDTEKITRCGPVSKRSCTDVPCCLLFLLFLVGFVIVTLWSFAMGDYRRVVYPTNSKGQVCGRDVPGRPYLYFFDLSLCLRMAPVAVFTGCPTPQVCVSSCPDYYWSWKSPYNTPNPLSARELMICLDGRNATDPEFFDVPIDELVRTRKCAPYTYNSKPVFGRCMPSQITRLLSNGTGRIYDNAGQQIVLTDAQEKRVSGVSVVRGREALIHMTSVFFWPLLPLVLELLVIAQVLFVSISLRSISDPVMVQDSNNQTLPPLSSEEKARKDLQEFFKLIPCDPLINSSAGKACRFLYYGDRKYTIFLQFFNVFMFFWLVNFVRSLAEMTLAGTFAHFYYSRNDPSTMPKYPLLQSFYRAAVFHIGSLALGSLLLAIFQWLRLLLEYVDAKLKKFDNGCTRICSRCCCCFLWCLERFIRFLNRNAFIMIAIHGQNFCSAARTAFNLLARNLVRVFVVDKVTDFLLFVGKLVVIVISDEQRVGIRMLCMLRMKRTKQTDSHTAWDRIFSTSIPAKQKSGCFTS
ncbi:hypothetical protein CRM22_004256 [Opisthorchis felineus]|uniref:Choline transporter-like protein n=1 Tax=Opisthorchis felineus TaxID=147828 RepID=A0A4S2LX46_OPIFE|nr:hypothetical protein CRM22_004256 [Opisthorchis felineus]